MRKVGHMKQITIREVRLWAATIKRRPVEWLVQQRTIFLRGVQATPDQAEKELWAEYALAVTQELNRRNGVE